MAYKPHDLLQFEPKFKVESKVVIVYQSAYNISQIPEKNNLFIIYQSCLDIYQ